MNKNDFTVFCIAFIHFELLSITSIRLHLTMVKIQFFSRIVLSMKRCCISELTIAEFKTCWLTEKEQLKESMKIKLNMEKEQAIKETKKKQWVSASVFTGYVINRGPKKILSRK